MAQLTQRNFLDATTNPSVSVRELFWNLAPAPLATADIPTPDDVVRHFLCVLSVLRECSGASGERAIGFLSALERDVAYAAPEQVLGQPTDERSLVFSTGALLFDRLLCNEAAPLLGSSQSVTRFARGSVNDMVLIGDELRRVINRAMAPFPDDRWPGLIALNEALRAYFRRASSESDTTIRKRPRTLPPPCPGSIGALLEEALRAARARKATDHDKPLLDDFLAPTIDPGVSHEAHAGQRLMPVARQHSGTFLVSLPRRHPALLLGIMASAILLFSLWLRAGSASSQQAGRELPQPPHVSAAAVGDGSRLSPVVTEPLTEKKPPTLTLPMFDEKLAGTRALEQMRPCFDEGELSTGIELGLSIRFAKESGLAERVYFAAGEVPERTHRICLEEALLGLSAGGPVTNSTVVAFTFWLSRKSARFWSGLPRT